MSATGRVTLADLLGLTDEQRAEMQAEYEAALKAIEESERQAALNAHKVFIR